MDWRLAEVAAEVAPDAVALAMVEVSGAIAAVALLAEVEVAAEKLRARDWRLAVASPATEPAAELIPSVKLMRFADTCREAVTG